MNDSKNIPQKAEPKSSWDENAPIFFMNWKEAALGENGDADTRSRRSFEIGRFLGFCKRERRPASITAIKRYLDGLREQGKLVAEARLALKWFVLEARKQAPKRWIPTVLSRNARRCQERHG